MFEVFDPGPPINNSDINSVEERLGIKFPDDYKQLMLKTNGGMVSMSFHLKDGSGGGHLSWLFHILAGDQDDIIYRNNTRKGRFPRGFVSIGPDPFGNAICINCLPGANYGKVYFWDHEMEAEPEDGETPETVDNYHLIADSFTEFLNVLYKRPEPTAEEMANVEDTSSPKAKARMKAMMEQDGLL